jgi:hypothetical protein
VSRAAASLDAAQATIAPISSAACSTSVVVDKMPRASLRAFVDDSSNTRPTASPTSDGSTETSRKLAPAPAFEPKSKGLDLFRGHGHAVHLLRPPL